MIQNAVNGFCTLPVNIVQTPMVSICNTSSSVNNISIDNFSAAITEMFYFKKTYYRIQEIAKLKKDWDGYGAIPIPREVINNAINLAYRLKYNSIIMPTSKPSIIFKSKFDKNEIYVELSEKNYSLFLYNYNQKHMEIKNRSINIEEILSVYSEFFGLYNVL